MTVNTDLVLKWGSNDAFAALQAPLPSRQHYHDDFRIDQRGY